MTLRERRDAAGLTQDGLAKAASISQGSVSSLELGNMPNPTMRLLESLARVYNCTVDDVILSLRETVQAASEVGA